MIDGGGGDLIALAISYAATQGQILKTGPDGVLTPTEIAISDVGQMRPGDGEFYVDDWLWLKAILLKPGQQIDQHVHLYDHPTVIGFGTVDAWIDGQHQGEITGLKVLTIRALAQHSFIAKTYALVLCAHNLRGEGYPALAGQED